MIILPRKTHFNHPLEKVVFHFWQPEKKISHEHTHEYCELFLVNSGRGIHVINEKPYLLTAGTLCYLNINDYHLFEEMKELKQVNLLYLGRENFNIIKNIDHLLPSLNEPNVWQIDISIMHAITRQLASYDENKYKDQFLAESNKEMLFLEVLHTLNEWRYKTQDFHSSKDRVGQIIIWLNSHLKCPLDIDRLCREFSISRRSLQREFIDLAGVSLQQYLSTTKLLRAKYYLQFTQMNVSEVADFCGFSDVSYFSRQFRKHFGISPKQLTNKQDLR